MSEKEKESTWRRQLQQKGLSGVERDFGAAWSKAGRSATMSFIRGWENPETGKTEFPSVNFVQEWLDKEHRQAEKRETCRFRILATIGVAGLCLTAVGIFLSL